MVKTGSIWSAWSAGFAILAVLMFSTADSAGQNYSADDTVTEYPNHGTFYHDRFEGRKTASGEVFDQNKFTAAHWKIKLGTYVMVTNRNTGLQVIVKVNDRCPKRGVLDMSHRAATAIGIRGCQPVTVRILPSSYMIRWATQEMQFDSVATHRTPVTKEALKGNIQKKSNTIPIFTQSGKPSIGYRIVLGTAASHSEAYTMTSRLPEAYQSHTVVESSEADDSLTVGLDLCLRKLDAEALLRALSPSFPKARIVPAE